jgi:isochorismate synthase
MNIQTMKSTEYLVHEYQRPSSTRRAISAAPSQIYQAAVTSECAVALWRRPGATSVQAMIDLNGNATPTQIDFRRRAPAFVFAPFVAEPAGTALRLNGDLEFDGEKLHAHHLNGSAERAARAARLLSALQTPAQGYPRWHTAPAIRAHVASRAEFTGLVRNAVDFIRTTGIAKVVVSRTAELPLAPDFDPAAAFLALAARYPHAFVSLVAIPGLGTWLGASPEVLLTLDDTGLTTMALAGTQARPAEFPLEDVRWGRKETLEQEMVSSYIRSFFDATGAGKVHETGPQTVAAGSIVHLQTQFRIDLPEDQRLALANRVLGELHPTSAVCGMPKHKALAFILAHEGYDRSFYSGFLGPMHVAGQSNLYVNLRCMQLGAHSAHLYVGAGITQDSQPDAEWRETELKAETMLSVLGTASPVTTGPVQPV